ncbi:MULTISPECIES: ComF family protein [Giesbergeria]|uniref:ComF family protein n=1 Tax=Giesbergeria sinuosa TaxID=80883 RepID=A0ABV9QCC4_9BURK
MTNPLFAKVSTAWHRLLAGVPSQCEVCRAWPAQRICEDCVARFARPRLRCRTCALPVPVGVVQCSHCLRQPPPLDACVAAVDYGFPWEHILGAYKFHGDPGWAGTLGQLLRSTPWAEPVLEAADLVLPLPLSPQRLRHRGFHQTLLLAQVLAADKVDAKLLLRVRNTPAQSGLGRAQRLENLQGAFALAPGRLSDVRGRRVVLLDDVMTTGTTLHTAATVLREAGAEHIAALVVARAA